MMHNPMMMSPQAQPLAAPQHYEAQHQGHHYQQAAPEPQHHYQQAAPEPQSHQVVYKQQPMCAAPPQQFVQEVVEEVVPMPKQITAPSRPPCDVDYIVETTQPVHQVVERVAQHVQHY